MGINHGMSIFSKSRGKKAGLGITPIIIVELTHSKSILENTVEIEPQPVALAFINLSQYSSCSK